MTGRLRYDDSGQGMLPLMVVVAFSILVITFSLLVPWGAATTEKAQSQTAADAAALAALQEKRQLWRDGTRPGVMSRASSVLLPGAAQRAGCGSALDYAGRNDADVTSCDLNRGGGAEVRVEVTNRRTSDEDTGRARSVASAEIDIDFPSCRWLLPVPPPPPTSGGPLTFEDTFRCGSWRATYELANTPPAYPSLRLVDSTPDELYRDLEPRLVE